MPRHYLQIFSEQALRHHKIRDDHYREKLKPVFEYIARYWKLAPKELESEPFDIRSCFTLLELQSHEAFSRNDRNAFVSLAEANYRLTVMLAEYLSDFEPFACTSDSFSLLGKIIYGERPVVLTFNYDTLLESAIESASGINVKVPPSLLKRPVKSSDIPDQELAYSHMNWNRPLGYGVKFDEVGASPRRDLCVCIWRQVLLSARKQPLLPTPAQTSWFDQLVCLFWNQQVLVWKCPWQPKKRRARHCSSGALGGSMKRLT